MNTVDELLRSYIAEYEESGDADPRPYLAQARGGERAELASRIDRYLAEAPAPAFDPAKFAAFRADPRRHALVERILDDTTLAQLRTEAAISKADVAKRLALRLGLEGRENRVKARYHDIEAGNVNPARVRPGVWETLAEAFGASVQRLRAAADRAFAADAGPAPASAFARFEVQKAHLSVALEQATGEPSQDDEVDGALFDA